MSLEEDLNVLIEGAAKTASDSVAVYKKLAEDTNGQLNGDDLADPGDWMKLAARAYAQLAGDAANTLVTGLDVLQRVAHEADEEGGGGTDG